MGIDYANIRKGETDMKKYWRTIAAIVLVVAIAATVALSTMDLRLRATDSDSSIGSGEVVEQQIELTEPAEENVPTQTQAPETAEPQTQQVEVYNTYDETQVAVTEAETTAAQADGQVATEAEKVAETTTVKEAEQVTTKTEKVTETTVASAQSAAAETAAEHKVQDTPAEPEGQETTAETTTESNDSATTAAATAAETTTETVTEIAAAETTAEAATEEVSEAATTAAETTSEEQTTTEEETTSAPNRSVRLKTNLDDGTLPYEGMEVVLTVELTGFEDCQYTIKWQRSTDNINWEDIPGATEEEYRFTLTEETNGYYWNAQVTVG